MSHSFYPPLMQRTSWTLAAPFKEQHHHRGPSDSIANNYSLMAQDLKLKDLLKVYQPATINVPRDRTGQGLPSSGTCGSVTPLQNGALEEIFIYLFILDGVSLCRPGWSAMARSRLIATSASRTQVILLPQPPE